MSCRDTQCWNGALDDKGYVNLYDITTHLVKPWTKGTGASIALRMNPEKPLCAELMISHSWAEDMDECLEALESYCQRSEFTGELSVWFCAFAQYQPGDEPGDIGPTVAEQLQLDPFGCVIRTVSCQGKPGGMVVVHTSMAQVYDRLWCVYEIAEALEAKTKVGIAYSQNYLRQSAGSVMDLLHAKTDHAKCSNPNDANMIREKVSKTGGFQELDKQIFEFRLKALQAMLSEFYGENWQQMLQEGLREAERVHSGKTIEVQRFRKCFVILILFLLVTVAALGTCGLVVTLSLSGADSGNEGATRLPSTTTLQTTTTTKTTIMTAEAPIFGVTMRTTTPSSDGLPTESDDEDGDDEELPASGNVQAESSQSSSIALILIALCATLVLVALGVVVCVFCWYHSGVSKLKTTADEDFTKRLEVVRKAISG